MSSRQEKTSKRKVLNGEKSRRRIRRIGERDNWICQLCRGPVIPIDPKIQHVSAFIHRASVDHINPISQGGEELDENLRLTHQSCNGYINGDNCMPYQPFDRAPYLIETNTETTETTISQAA